MTVPLIFCAQTDTWRLEITGQLPDLPRFVPLVAITSIEMKGTAKLRVYSRTAGNLVDVQPGELIEPVWFENTQYDFYLKSPSEDTTLELPPTARVRHKLDQITHCSINFHNDIGWAEIVVRTIEDSTAIQFEVFPLKIDYRADYMQMRDEISAITRNLAMTVQARTFGFAEPAPSDQPTLAEWLSLIRYHFDKLVAVTRAISQNPHSKLVKVVRSVPPERARRVDGRALARSLRSTIKRPGGILPDSTTLLPARVPEVVRRVTFDTPENQYVKSLLLETRHNLKGIIRADVTGDEDADLSAEQKFFKAIRPDVEDMLLQVGRLLRTPFLQEVTVTPATPSSSLVFHRHPHYAAFAKIGRLLNGGLSLSGEVLQIGVKNVALLYEYWCFLKLVELLRERYSLQQQSIVKVKHLRVAVVLSKGTQSRVTFKDRASGRSFYLVYNRLFSDLPTIPQRPDNVIQMAAGSEFYVFDAKYRLAFDSSYQRRYGGPGPTVEDVNTMHRYRDAIALPHPLKEGAFLRGVVKAAIVLFPYPFENEYEQHRFFRSIGSVQIGGLPFLPQATSLVEDHAREILALIEEPTN